MPFGALVEEVFNRITPLIPTPPRSTGDSRLDDRREKRSPDLAKSLEENGVGHKSLHRFWTPGLDGYKHSRS